MAADGLDAILFSVGLTLRITIVATCISAIAGILLGYVMRAARFPGASLVDAILTLPMVLPPTVLGYYLILLLGRNGWAGSLLYHWFDFSILFTVEGAIVAATVVSYPLVYRAARGAFESLPPEYEETAASLGHGPISTFIRVSLPLAWKGILAGMMLAFARSIGEFGATLMVAGNIPGKTRTLSLAIYSAVEAGNDGLALLLVLAASVLCVTILVFARQFFDRSFL